MDANDFIRVDSRSFAVEKYEERSAAEEKEAVQGQV